MAVRTSNYGFQDTYSVYNSIIINASNEDSFQRFAPESLHLAHEVKYKLSVISRRIGSDSWEVDERWWFQRCTKWEATSRAGAPLTAACESKITCQREVNEKRRGIEYRT